jgi:hypothetical protein
MNDGDAIMKSRFRLSAVLGALALTAGSLFAQENYATWKSYRTITVNTAADGANVAGSVTNYPLAVRLTSAQADVFANGGVNGANIRFTLADGTTRLKYEREMYDTTSQQAVFWVLVPSVAGNASTTIRMYYGRVGVADSSSSTAVFDTTTTGNGFRAVYHMSAGSGVATEKDATALANNLAASDSVPQAIPTDTVGAIGRARTFAGDTSTIAGRQYFVAPGTRAKPELNWGSTNSHTVSAWVYARDIIARANHGNSIINKGDNMYALQVYGSNASATAKKWESAVYSQSWRQIPSKGTTLATTGSWKYIVGTWSGGATSTNATGQIYVDGVLDSSATTLAVGNGNQIKSWNLFVGANPNGGGLNSTDSAVSGGGTRTMVNAPNLPGRARYWNGHLDEIRLAQGVRSADWVKLDFETQKPTATAVSVGTATAQTVTVDTVKNVYYLMPGTGNTPRDTIVFQGGVAVNLPLNFTGGPQDSIKITTGTLPAGLTLDKGTGRITGTPTAVTAAANQTLTIYTAIGNVTRGLRTSVIQGTMKIVKYAQDTVTYNVGVPVLNTPVMSAVGRAATGFSVTPALPAGLKIDTVNGAISGTPTAAVAAANYTVKAVNATDTSLRVVRITTTGTAEDYSTWTKHRTIWLNTAANSNGAKTTTDVRNFPVLVRLSGTDTVFTQALAGGADLRFTKADNTTLLPYQIERWDTAGKQAAVWVLVDTVKANSLTQTIRMHWGKTGVTSLSSGATTFGTNNGFQAVWHMVGGTGDEPDATVNGLTTSAINAPADSAGLIGRGRYLDGSTQYFQALNTASGPLNLNLTHNYALSAWVKLASVTTNTGDGHKIIDKGDNQYVLAVYGNTGDDNGQHFWEITTRGNNTYNQCTSNTASTGANNCTGTGTPITAESGVGIWTHVVGQYQGAPVSGAVAESLYVNGALVSTRQFTNTNNTGRNENFNVSLGVQAAGTAPLGTTFTRYLNGILDEVRISNALRSADWIKLEYANQKPNQTLVSFVQPVSIKGAGAASVAGPSLAVSPSGRGLMFSLQGVQGRASVSMIDMWGRTVWNGEFANGVAMWDGRANSGSSVSPGLYVARVSVRDAQGKVTQVMNRKIPLTR